MSDEKISIITVCFNAEKSIEKTIQSVISQTYPNIEYIVIDGGSTDDTQNILRSHKNHINTLISEKDEGIYDAMNKGLGQAHGDFVYFLNSGDYLHRNTILAEIVRSIQKNDAYDLYTGDIIYYDSKGSECLSGYRENHVDYLEKVICHQAIIARKSVFDRYGNFDTRYKIYADYDWLLRCVFQHQLKVYYTGLPIAYYLKDGKSDTSWKRYVSERKEIITKYADSNQILSYALHNPFAAVRYVAYRLNNSLRE